MVFLGVFFLGPGGLTFLKSPCAHPSKQWHPDLAILRFRDLFGVVKISGTG